MSLIKYLCTITLTFGFGLSASAEGIEFRQFTADFNSLISWYIPRALIEGDSKDYQLFINLLERRTPRHTPPQDEIADIEVELRNTLLSRSGSHQVYYHRLKFVADRPHIFPHREFPLKTRKALFNSLMSIAKSPKASSARDLHQIVVKSGFAPIEQLAPLQLSSDDRQAVTERLVENQYGLDVNFDICSKFDPGERAPDASLAQFYVIDAAHFGKGYDLRDFMNYREGKTALIVSQLLRYMLTDCLGVPANQVFVTRGDLNSINGKSNKTIRNDALLNYRADLVGFMRPTRFVSIHTNASPEKNVNTAGEPLYGDQRFSSSRLEAFAPVRKISRYRNSGRVTYPATTTDESLKLSSELIDSLTKAFDSDVFGHKINERSSHVSTFPFRVFQSLDSDVAAVLIEGFYHTNSKNREHLLESSELKLTVGPNQYDVTDLHIHYALGIAKGLMSFDNKLIEINRN